MCLSWGTGLSPGITAAIPAWLVAQAVLGAVANTFVRKLPPKQGQLHIMAAARGAAQGVAADRSILSDSGGTSCGPGSCYIGALDRVLIELQKHMGTDYPPVVSEAKQWLRAQGAVKAASTLGKLSSSRNLQAHSAGERVLAAAAALPGSRVQTDDKRAGCATFGVGPKLALS